MLFSYKEKTCNSNGMLMFVLNLHILSTTLLNESEPESLEDSSDAIPEGKPESTQLRNKSALHVPDVNSSRAT